MHELCVHILVFFKWHNFLTLDVEDIEFWVIFVIENSTKLQKTGLEREINWVSNSHLGQQHISHLWTMHFGSTLFLKSQYIKGTHKLNMWNIFLPTYILFNIWTPRCCALLMMINSFYIWFSKIHHYLCQYQI
jgi:hypothetical protein